MKALSTPTSPPATDQIRELRHSSRLLVRALGLMHNRLEVMECTPAQCHVLIELSGRGRMTTGELAEVLEVDKSTASRTLRPLLRGGLIEMGADPDDQRIKPMRLSDAGRERVRKIHAAADGQVQDALELLTEEERATVLRGVSLYEQALHRAKALSGLVVRPIEARDEPAVAAIIRGALAEFDAVGRGYSSENAEVDEMFRAYSGDRRVYFVAERNGELLAGGGIAPLAGHERGDVCELRKMYALPSARGLGIGRVLLDRCLSAAREEGYRLCYLETLRHMHRARALYEKVGFQTLNRPMGTTGHYGCDGWYALEL